MKIAICASEAAPYAKSGGLGDVMEALPKALAAIEGNEVALFLPYYNKIKTNTAILVEKVAQFRVQMGWRQQFAGLMKLTTAPGGVTVPISSSATTGRPASSLCISRPATMMGF